MRILFVSQYFSPEITAAPLRLQPLAAGLAARGHEVEVICEVPSHPQGVIYPGFGAKPLQRREMDGFRASYVWAWPARSKHPISRLASYGSYAATASLAGLFAKRPDVVFASSPPLSVGLVGRLVASLRRVPWVLDVRDLWPQVAEELGSVRSGFALRTAARLERRLYRGAAGVTVATEPFRDHVAALAESTEAMVLPNGTTREWMGVGDSPADRAGAALAADRFVWTYAGNVGLSQGLEVAVEAARQLGHGFQLLILGDGASRPRLEALAAETPAGSVVFRDSIPPAEAAIVMRASDALLVSLSDRPALGKTVPVKLYDSAALARPIVLAAPGELRSLAEETGIAEVVSPGDPTALAAVVRRLRDEPALGERLAGAARGFAAANLREDQVERLEGFLGKVAGGS